MVLRVHAACTESGVSAIVPVLLQVLENSTCLTRKFMLCSRRWFARCRAARAGANLLSQRPIGIASVRVCEMDFETLERLRQGHPAWRLLKADNAVLVTSFLHRTFVKPNVRSVSEAELGLKLEDYLFHLRREVGEDRFPCEVGVYLEDWASDKHGWLRKYYPDGTDEPAFDITPATKQAIDWLASLSRRPFIGTQSRLVAQFELLRQLADGTDSNPKTRIAEL